MGPKMSPGLTNLWRKIPTSIVEFRVFLPIIPTCRTLPSPQPGGAETPRTCVTCARVESAPAPPHRRTATAPLQAPSVGAPFLPLWYPQAPRSAKHTSCLKMHISFRPHRAVPCWLSNKKVTGPPIPVPLLLGPQNSLTWALRLRKIFCEDIFICFCLLLLSLLQTETQALRMDKHLSTTRRGTDVPVQINSLRTSLPFQKPAKRYLTLNVLPHPVSYPGTRSCKCFLYKPSP